MSYPVNSTSVETHQIARVNRVLGRALVGGKIAYAGVFVCKKIVGSTPYSQHSWGNAADLFPKQLFSDNQGLHEIAVAVVRHTTKRTFANLGRKLEVAEVIDHNNRLIWTPSQGWHAYGGTTGEHIHVSGSPLKSGIPPCAR